ncbi:MAG: glycosyltransferase, partial [Chloroflexota bacterium]
GSLNEYAFHFIRQLRKKPEVDEVIMLVDHLPAGESYPADDPKTDGQAALRFVPCWRFDAIDNAPNILSAVREVAPDVMLFNLQFATFGGSRIPAALGLSTPLLVKNAGFVTVVLLHNIMEAVDLSKAGFGGNPIAAAVTRTAGTLFTRALLRADLVAVTIPKYVEILTEKYKADNAFLAPHGAFDELPEPTLDLPEGRQQVMTFGKFGTYKRVEALIKAFDMIQRRRDVPIELVIAGSDNPNVKGYLDSMKQQFAHVSNVRYTGYVAEKDVPRIFCESAVVVFPYNSTTGSSGVLHQAGSFARAVALPNLGDLAELVTEEGYVGEFFEPDDPVSMAAAIERILENDDHRRQMGLRNFRAAQGVPIGEVVDWYLLHFERLLT